MLSNIDPLTTSFVFLLNASKYGYLETSLPNDQQQSCWGQIIPLPGNRPFPETFVLLEENKGLESRPSAYTFTTLASRHVVVVNAALRNLKEASQRFILLHECGHIHHRDSQMHTVIDLIVLIVAHIFFPLPMIYHAYVIMRITTQVFEGMIAERRADAFACEQATLEELQGGIEFFQMKSQLRATEWSSAITLYEQAKAITNAFIYYVLQGHPLESNRITSIEKEIQRRKIHANFAASSLS